MHTYDNWGELRGLCALLFVSNELFQNDFVQIILLNPHSLEYKGRCSTPVETMLGDRERQQRLLLKTFWGACVCGKGQAGPCPGETVPCSASPPQLWITDVHTEDVEEVFRSRID